MPSKPQPTYRVESRVTKKNTCVVMFTVSGFMKTKRWRQTSYLLTDEQINKWGKYGVLKMTEILTHPEDILLGEIG